jgi:hypothetical protein
LPRPPWVAPWRGLTAPALPSSRPSCCAPLFFGSFSVPASRSAVLGLLTYRRGSQRSGPFSVRAPRTMSAKVAGCAEPDDGLGLGVVRVVSMLAGGAALGARLRFGVGPLGSRPEATPGGDAGERSREVAAPLRAELVSHLADGLPADLARRPLGAARVVVACRGAVDSPVAGVVLPLLPALGAGSGDAPLRSSGDVR